MPRKEPRNYKEEYKDYHGKPKQIKNRVKRDQARRALGRDGMSSKDGKEVDHIKPLSKGGGNKNNTRVISRAANRRKGNKT
jgi:5-methylcytosine-specific restriction endonuclease McrA